MQSYGDLIQAVHQELGNHRSDCRLGTQTQNIYTLMEWGIKSFFQILKPCPAEE